jgi:phosphopantetheinyl transferase
MLLPFLQVESAAREIAKSFAGLAVASLPVAQAPDCRRDGGALGLVRGEQALYRQFRCAPRRAQFLAGRLAARRALARLLDGTTSGQPEILPDAMGAPVVVGYPSVRVSITHSNDIALAVAAHVPVGIDLEADEPRPAGFSRLFFSPAEQCRLCTSGKARQTLLNTLWTRKEAVSKVGHWGGTLPFASLDCLDSSMLVEDSPIEVRSGCAAGYVLSVATAERRSFAHG